MDEIGGNVTEPSNAEKLLAAYAAGQRNFSHWELSGADLRGADLRGAILYGANLRGADLRGANLEGGNLGEAKLRGANLTDANLRDVFVARADLAGATLTDPTIAARATPNAQYCASCGAPVPPGSAFCPRCGRPLAPAQPQAWAPVPPMAPYAQPMYAAPVYPVYAPAPYAQAPYATPAAYPYGAPAAPAYAMKAPKSPGLAALFEFLLAGVGLMYAGSVGSGIAVLCGTCGASFVFGLILVQSVAADPSSASGMQVCFGIFALIWLALRLTWAYNTAKGYNAQLGARVRGRF